MARYDIRSDPLKPGGYSIGPAADRAPLFAPMNTYRLMKLESGRWGIEWLVDGRSQGLVWGWFATEGVALFAAIDLASMEHREGVRSLPFDRRRRRSA
jgi:hypothetical protein